MHAAASDFGLHIIPKLFITHYRTPNLRTVLSPAHASVDQCRWRYLRHEHAAHAGTDVIRHRHIQLPPEQIFHDQGSNCRGSSSTTFCPTTPLSHGASTWTEEDAPKCSNMQIDDAFQSCRKYSLSDKKQLTLPCTDLGAIPVRLMSSTSLCDASAPVIS